ncbi:helix-turn-helix domain-containing protein [Solimicrobium silvestre]|uniref:Cro/C1-type HTH DNA-binding domain n=1 Tax=Solimicrobium silvestre TaxID=2099400 RepID=A0A2S9GZY3_9BURK|nr:helix-turn-helix domain-containing protein [Solimicrobium silvestre]PRC93294.1 Cro/C1-type HTH DNA-binding domain [Solimicrobium silvestre]
MTMPVVSSFATLQTFDAMSKAITIIDALKRELKNRDITYADLAERIRMSEASVKRMFSQKNFTLQRLDEILLAAEIDFHDLTSHEHESKLILELSYEQEQEIISDPKKFLVAVSALNLLTLEQIVDIYAMTEAEVVGYLLRLDKIGFLELQPNNRIKLLVARTFKWISNGPIQHYFKAQAYADYLNSDFDGQHEIMRLVNVMLSRPSIDQLLTRLKQVAREFSEQHQTDAKLPLTDKHRISFMLAARPWLPDEFKKLVRKEWLEKNSKEMAR